MGRHHQHQAQGKNLGIAVFLNLLISAGQLVGGLISGSLSLLSDALHNFSDVLSLLLSWFAHRLARKPANSTYTFGYKRAEILAAFVNALTLIIIAVFLIIEAIKRSFHPEKIESVWVIYFALASIVINVLSVLLLHQDARHSLNIKSAYLHLLTDVMTSVAVLIGGLLMKYYEIYWVDSLLSMLIAGFLIFSSWNIFRHSLRILMQATPEHLDLQELKEQMLSYPEIKQIIDLHIWSLDEHENYLQVKISLQSDMSCQDFEILKEKIEKLLPENIKFYLMPVSS